VQNVFKLLKHVVFSSYVKWLYTEFVRTAAANWHSVPSVSLLALGRWPTLHFTHGIYLHVPIVIRIYRYYFSEDHQMLGPYNVDTLRLLRVRN
jgi:hypothetical protein